MTRNKFTVSLPKTFFWYMFCGAALFVFLPMPFTILHGVQHVALYILCGMMSLPFICFMIKSKLFKITVNGQKITLRKGIGLYNFDVSEIEKVDWKITITRLGQNKKIAVRTASKRFSVKTLMVGFDRMSEYIFGRQFAVDNQRIGNEQPQILMFEPGSAEVLEIPCNIINFTMKKFQSITIHVWLRSSLRTAH